MKTLEYHTIDKATWPRGVWDDEPDKKQWQDVATGLPCLAVRNRFCGDWCGYVGVAPKHPFFGKRYDDVALEEIAVHGGLTFAGPCSDGPEATAICHLPEAGEPDLVYWLGFDCAHCDDLRPAADSRGSVLGWQLYADTVYRPLSYVETQCRLLAEQLVVVAQ